ncbi:MAG TPA: RNA polymerase sigma factor [Chitinophagaceae bacterium]|nr:RNA polymerase sigma factor [Chitinophagaceae bacterium]
MTEQGFNNCVEQHADGLYRFICKNLRNTEDARDIVQNSFEILWKRRAEITENKAKAYLFTVGYHNMIDHLRKMKPISLPGEFREESRGTIKQAPVQLKAILEEALGRLTDMQRSLVLLKDYEGYSYEEIGNITSLNPSQVKVYLHRARLKMKDYMVKKENVI